MDFSVIIVNYKCWADLKVCLSSLIKIDQNDFSFEVIVVDNKSNDGELNKFSSGFSSIVFIENSGNNGFANGCNKGASIAKGNFLLFLNPDTIVSKEPFLSMLKLAQENLDYGIISCTQINRKGSREKVMRFFPSFKNLFGFSRALFKLFDEKIMSKRFNTLNGIIFPDWVSGSVVFLSRIWFDKIQGWNEDYWMYYEDVDLCKKVLDFGGTVALLKDIEVVHNHGGSSRINLKTASITKTEVLVSKHVYINNHFTGIKHFILQLLIITNNLIGKMIFAVVGVIFIFIPKLRLNIYLFINIIKYYFTSITNRTWLSNKSMNHPTKI